MKLPIEIQKRDSVNDPYPGYFVSGIDDEGRDILSPVSALTNTSAADEARLKPLTKTEIETLANNIHNNDDYAYTIECLTHHLARPQSAAVTPKEQEPVAWRWSFDDGTTWHYGPSNDLKHRFGPPDIVEPLLTSPQPPAPVVDEVAIRRAALEEAAKVAETGDWYGTFQTVGDERRARSIATRIRALKEGE